MAFKRAKLEQKEAVRFGLDRESLAIGLPFFPEEVWNDTDKIKMYGFRIAEPHHDARFYLHSHSAQKESPQSARLRLGFIQIKAFG